MNDTDRIVYRAVDRAIDLFVGAFKALVLALAVMGALILLGMAAGWVVVGFRMVAG